MSPHSKKQPLPAARRFGLARRPPRRSHFRVRRTFPVWLGFFAAATLHGGPAEATIVAAMKLSDEPNYAWVTTVVDDARTYEIVGQTTKAGYTRVRMPLINSVRRRLGRSYTDPHIEAIFKGNVKCVLRTDNGWLLVDEIVGPDEPGLDVVLQREAQRNVVNKPPPPRRDEIPVATYSNLQLAISHPHEELAVIVTSHNELKVDGDTATGTLNDIGAALLLVRDGQDEITPLRASGHFKLWLAEGRVTRYQVTLTGLLAISTPVGRREIRVHQKTDTVLKNVGTTKFDVPTEARMKL